jgi:hypothetical protein
MFKDRTNAKSKKLNKKHLNARKLITVIYILMSIDRPFDEFGTQLDEAARALNIYM